MIINLKKEVCSPCERSIKIGQPILECEVCFSAIHTKCYKKAGYTSTNGYWACVSCTSNLTPRYNPFPNSQMGDSVQDKFYDDEGAYDDTVIQSISSVLDSCKSYTSKEVTEVVKQLDQQCNSSYKLSSSSKSSKFSSYFINIDGNKTNFDNLCVDLKRIEYEFSVIAIAETNVDSELNKLYRIPNYEGFYQNTISGKSKGTGVALYVHRMFNVDILDSLGHCNADIESLFIKISSPTSDTPLTIGVIYRPPSGNIKNFMDTFETLCSSLPDSGVRILGDYNIDFLQMNSNTNVPSQFEDNFLSKNLAPVISIPTHHRLGCNPSCIDNILTNDVDKILFSGTISDCIGEHLPIFEISDIQFVNESKKDKQMMYYDFCNANLNKFVEKLESDLSDHRASTKFSEFTNVFGKALDDTCKLEKPKTTKRTYQNNPWITPSIISAVDKKHELKDNWVKTIKKDAPRGDPVLRKIFTAYRTTLTCVIDSAKKSYTCNQVLENKTDRKKTWKIINELRGKSKGSIKPSLVIDNKKIINRRVISNEFNKYFNTVATKLNDTLSNQMSPDGYSSSFEEFMPPENKNSIYLEDCTSDELLELISELDNNKASDIPIRIIKKSAHVIAPVMSEYFNMLMAK